MRTERYDVLVIGAGPAGSRAAELTAAAGLSTLLIEKRPRIGSPVRCAEAVGPREVVERFVRLDENAISSPVHGFAIISPSGKRYEAHWPDIGLIVDRERFDASIAAAASEAGARVLTSHQALSLLGSGGSVEGAVVADLESGERFEARAAVTVGADGVESLSPRWAGLKGSHPPAEVMSCAQELVEGIDMSKRLLEFHIGSRRAPGGYAWVFPKGENRANVGLGVNPAMTAGGVRAADLLESFLEERCPGARRSRPVCGGTLVARGLRRLATDGYLAVGEAANQNNPFSGGGIVNALEGATIAAETIVEALGRGENGAGALGGYTRRWRKGTGRDNGIFWHAARSFYRLPDSDMERLIDRMKRTPGVVENGGIRPMKLLRAVSGAGPGTFVRFLAARLGG